MTYNSDKANINEYVDFWYYDIGANVFPILYRKKKTYVEWSNFQEKTVSEQQLNQWKNAGEFNNGIAVMAGKIWRGPYEGEYLACIDIDNQKGIEEFLEHFGKLDTIGKLAEKTIVEWHRDDPNKIHIYFIVEKPLTKKSGIHTNKIENNEEIPAIEVKSEGHHGIMIVSPSIHKNGLPYEIMGTKVPTVLNETQSEELETVLNSIYKKYNSNYQADATGPSSPIKELFEPGFRVSEGNNRHEALLKVMESLIKRNRTILAQEKIKNFAYIWNQEHCKPPLNDKEFEKQWKDAKKFILKKEFRKDNDVEKSITENEEIEYLKTIKQRYISIFYDQLNKLYVTIKINDHIETIPVDSSRFKFLIRKEILENENKTINDDKLDRIIKSLQAEMVFDENIERKELNLRVASKDDVVYYDLTNQGWEIIKITSKGWDIVKDNSIPLFKRYENNSIPQVYPKKNDENDGNRKYFIQFMNLFNLRTPRDRLLLENYLISLFIPNIQKAILVISGNGGGAKTTTFNLIKNIIDPSTVDTLSFSPSKNDLIQSLEHNYVTYFDNVSYISQLVSDVLCRAVTGSGDSKRELYTTDGIFVYKFRRCIGINGINLATTRPDFIDRSLILRVERIPKEKRRKEEGISREFERLRPFVLGYIFDILVKYQKYREDHKDEPIIKNPPRMADFAESCEIISRCLSHPENAFIDAYRENIDNQNDEIIESSPVAESIIAFMENKKSWIGTPTQLLQLLGDIISQVNPSIRNSTYWPKIAARLTYKTNEIIPNLLKRRIEIVTGEKVNGKRVIKITKIDSNPSSTEKKDSESSSSLSPSLDLSINYINQYIHRRDSSDIFDCEKCSSTGDIHFMKDHPCKNI